MNTNGLPAATEVVENAKVVALFTTEFAGLDNQFSVTIGDMNKDGKIDVKEFWTGAYFHAEVQKHWDEIIAKNSLPSTTTTLTVAQITDFWNEKEPTKDHSADVQKADSNGDGKIDKAEYWKAGQIAYYEHLAAAAAEAPAEGAAEGEKAEGGAEDKAAEGAKAEDKGDKK